MKLFWLAFFLLPFCPVSAQDTIFNKKTIKIIRDEKAYVRSITYNPGLALVDLRRFIPGICLDLRYATDSNFTTQKIYPATTTAYMRRKAVSCLLNVQKELKTMGMGLKIFDAYRPYSATELIWQLVKDERYAANPAKGSNHNRGIAVDLTIIDLKTMKELDMGTGFDNFSDTAHHNFKSLPGTVIKNRQLLRNIMEKNGFIAMETEWWHYALPNPKKYDLLDISFAVLSKHQPKEIHTKKYVESSVPASSGQPVQKQ